MQCGYWQSSEWRDLKIVSLPRQYVSCITSACLGECLSTAVASCFQSPRGMAAACPRRLWEGQGLPPLRHHVDAVADPSRSVYFLRFYRILGIFGNPFSSKCVPRKLPEGKQQKRNETIVFSNVNVLENTNILSNRVCCF